jgi:hypothetical protein
MKERKSRHTYSHTYCVAAGPSFRRNAFKPKVRKEETWKRKTYDDDNCTKQVCTPAMQVHSASERQILRSSL